MKTVVIPKVHTVKGGKLMVKLTEDQIARAVAMRRLPHKMRAIFLTTAKRYQENFPMSKSVPYNVIVDLLLAGWRLTQAPVPERVNMNPQSESGDHD
jgi:hypothetical protein